MKIGIDARFFGPKDRGLGRYTENLIANLEKTTPSSDGNQYFIFLRKERWNDYNPENSNFKKILFSRLRGFRLDLMHFTYFKVPIFYKGKFVVTIHDLILSHVNLHKRTAYKIILKFALKRAKKIITVSNYTKQELIKYHKVNPDKIKVIYEGVS